MSYYTDDDDVDMLDADEALDADTVILWNSLDEDVNLGTRLEGLADNLLVTKSRHVKVADAKAKLDMAFGEPVIVVSVALTGVSRMTGTWPRDDVDAISDTARDLCRLDVRDDVRMRLDCYPASYARRLPS